MGKLAWIEIRKVPDILVHDEDTLQMTIGGGDPKKTIGIARGIARTVLATSLHQRGLAGLSQLQALSQVSEK